jgi:ubiquinone/menaquinone biosynthesis C-methylase UbiE
VGGINFFSDRRRALHEMLRVARPATKIIVSDESDEVVTGLYQRIPFVNRFYRRPTAPVSSPAELLPQGTLDIQFRIVNRGKLYCLTFRK